MSTVELQSQLHKIIDQVTDERVLKAVHTLLSSKINIYAHSSDGQAITKEELDSLLSLSEEDIRTGNTTSVHDLKIEIESWRKK